MKKLLLFSFIFLSSLLLKSQSTQIFTEDFQTGGTSFTLNSGGPGSSMGNNTWIVNNNYTGAPTYPNTMREDSTYSGTIAFAPYSQYLHIHDAASGITDCNYNPTNASDNFAYMTSGICTLGMDSVHFSFFYLCEGSATAYGQVYYSANGGPWIEVGLSAYNSKYKWKYEDISDPAFSNVGNLRFGFRWINNSGIAVNTEAFAIDDIDIVGYYNSTTGVSITVDSVTPDPVCRGNTLFIYYHLSDTLCDGTYQVELSNPTGTSFPGTVGWIYNIYFPTTSGVIPVMLPTTVAAGGCYKIRINRTSPPPIITGVASACFSIINCPNIITTLQPVVTLDTNAVCVGSDIDVPFYSTGVYSFNTYTAQLSDSSGTFPTTPTVIGSSMNSATYDPSLGSPPGTVSGQIPNVPPGCNYYIRVVSSSPASTGSVWGPFCIGQCDINTNHNTDLHFCVVDCATSSLGIDSVITIGDSSATYFPGNQFMTQMMSMMTFAQIGPNGILGAVAATTDTTLNIHIPCKDSLPIVGIPIGTNYMRIIATNSSEPDNALGSLIRVTIGAPHTNGELITSYNYSTFMAQDTFCVGESAFFLFNPYSYSDNSTYIWQSPEINGGNPFVSPSGANSNSLFLAAFTSPGIYTFHVQETNYGCVGPWSPTDTVVVLGPPVVTISGPTVVCQGDTAHYSVPFGSNTYYSWTASGGTIVDTANNIINMIFNTTGSYHITMNAINQCGPSSAIKNIIVKPYPTINVENDTTICIHDPLTLSTTTGAGYNYSWTNGASIVSSTNTASVSPTTTTTYVLTVTASGGCKRKDTITVHVQTPPTSTYADSVCPNGTSPVTLSADTTGTYLWSTGATTQQIIVNDTGTYTVAISNPGKTCPKIVTFHVADDPCPVPVILTLPNVFSPNGDGANDFFTPITSGDFDKFDVKIYNRWGQLLYESNDPFFKWNGNDKTGKAVDGVYYYIVTTTLNTVDNKQDGFITLTR
ncbi:MAG: T9SS type B sorting domain-containing protein [Bacteroidia bacterium]